MPVGSSQGLPAESTGLLRHTRKWSSRSLETISIGQEISVTAIQMVQAFGAIANGGVLMTPVIAYLMWRRVTRLRRDSERAALG